MAGRTGTGPRVTTENVMNTAATLRDHAELAARALADNPTMARSSGCTNVRLRGGLTCEIEDGRWRLVADLPEGAGGADAGPNPGVLMRSALGSCLAMDIFTWGVRLGVPVDAVDVEVRSELDARGMYGVSEEVPPGYSEVFYLVTIESSASEPDVLRVLEKAEAHNPRLYDFSHAIPVRRDVCIRRPF